MTHPMPAWLQRHLEATGDAGPDAVTRRARIKVCKQCGQTILAGLDGDPPMAGNAYVDPTPLAPMGEALALLADRPTYELLWTGLRLELEHRSAQSIEGHPAGTRSGVDVVAEHACGSAVLPSLPSAHARPTIAAGYAGDPPF